MSTTQQWAELHDAVLLSLEVRWSSGEALVQIRMGTQRFIVASNVRRLDCARAMPWGPSNSINELRGPTPVADDSAVLEIEMQSGDLIRIEAGAFALQDAP